MSANKDNFRLFGYKVSIVSIISTKYGREDKINRSNARRSGRNCSKGWQNSNTHIGRVALSLAVQRMVSNNPKIFPSSPIFFDRVSTLLTTSQLNLGGDNKQIFEVCLKDEFDHSVSLALEQYQQFFEVHWDTVHNLATEKSSIDEALLRTVKQFYDGGNDNEQFSQIGNLIYVNHAGVEKKKVLASAIAGPLLEPLPIVIKGGHVRIRDKIVKDVKALHSKSNVCFYFVEKPEEIERVAEMYSVFFVFDDGMWFDKGWSDVHSNFFFTGNIALNQKSKIFWCGNSANYMVIENVAPIFGGGFLTAETKISSLNTHFHFWNRRDGAVLTVGIALLVGTIGYANNAEDPSTFKGGYHRLLGDESLKSKVDFFVKKFIDDAKSRKIRRIIVLIWDKDGIKSDMFEDLAKELKQKDLILTVISAGVSVEKQTSHCARTCHHRVFKEEPNNTYYQVVLTSLDTDSSLDPHLEPFLDELCVINCERKRSLAAPVPLALSDECAMEFELLMDRLRNGTNNGQ